MDCSKVVVVTGDSCNRVLRCGRGGRGHRQWGERGWAMVVEVV